MSNDPKWTPGPWVKSPHVDPGDGVQVKDERGIPVCRCSIVPIYDGGPIKTTTHRQRNANAYLIAAAPDGYALAELVMDICGNPKGVSEAARTELYEAALQYAKKARGEP
ncbi:hypothetical protein ACFQH5_20440 [Halomonas salifodinae]|uniref:Uncharacterized protein n=1 Tax=Halomonas salifodinae TaxID=438745 RepID=A0ABW2F5T7_9GAMM